MACTAAAGPLPARRAAPVPALQLAGRPSSSGRPFSAAAADDKRRATSAVRASAGRRRTTLRSEELTPSPADVDDTSAEPVASSQREEGTNDEEQSAPRLDAPAPAKRRGGRAAVAESAEPPPPPPPPRAPRARRAAPRRAAEPAVDVIGDATEPVRRGVAQLSPGFDDAEAPAITDWATVSGQGKPGGGSGGGGGGGGETREGREAAGTVGGGGPMSPSWGFQLQPTTTDETEMEGEPEKEGGEDDGTESTGPLVPARTPTTAATVYGDPADSPPGARDDAEAAATRRRLMDKIVVAAKARAPWEAEAAIAELTARGMRPGPRAYHGLISSHVRAIAGAGGKDGPGGGGGAPRGAAGALRAAWAAHHDGERLLSATYCTLIKGFLAEGDPATAEECLAGVKRAGYPQPDLAAAWNTLAAGLFASGHAPLAWTHVMQGQAAGLQPDSATFLCMTVDLCAAGRWRDALAAVQSMPSSGVPPEPRHYAAVLRAQARAGGQDGGRRLALKTFLGMMASAEAPVAPDLACFNALLEAHANDRGAGPETLASLMEVRTAMSRAGVTPDAETHALLLEVYSDHGDVLSALRTLQELQRSAGVARLGAMAPLTGDNLAEASGGGPGVDAAPAPLVTAGAERAVVALLARLADEGLGRELLAALASLRAAGARSVPSAAFAPDKWGRTLATRWLRDWRGLRRHFRPPPVIAPGNVLSDAAAESAVARSLAAAKARRVATKEAASRGYAYSPSSGSGGAGAGSSLPLAASKLAVGQLRALCTTLGLDATGTKAVLYGRYQDARRALESGTAAPDLVTRATQYDVDHAGDDPGMAGVLAGAPPGGRSGESPVGMTVRHGRWVAVYADDDALAPSDVKGYITVSEAAAGARADTGRGYTSDRAGAAAAGAAAGDTHPAAGPGDLGDASDDVTAITAVDPAAAEAADRAAVAREMATWLAAVAPDRSDVAIATSLLDAGEALGGRPTPEDYRCLLDECLHTRAPGAAADLLHRAAVGGGGAGHGDATLQQLGELAAEAALAGGDLPAARRCESILVTAGVGPSEAMRRLLDDAIKAADGVAARRAARRLLASAGGAEDGDGPDDALGTAADDELAVDDDDGSPDG